MTAVPSSDAGRALRAVAATLAVVSTAGLDATGVDAIIDEAARTLACG
jgi:hypothetical protein